MVKILRCRRPDALAQLNQRRHSNKLFVSTVSKRKNRKNKEINFVCSTMPVAYELATVLTPHYLNAFRIKNIE